MALKLVVDTREFALEKSRLCLGRKDGLEVVIKDPMVSSNHCTIHNGVLLDKGSTNGTFVNDEKVHYGEPVRLFAGDVISIGQTRLCVVDASAGAGPASKEDEYRGADSHDDKAPSGAGSADLDATQPIVEDELFSPPRTEINFLRTQPRVHPDPSETTDRKKKKAVRVVDANGDTHDSSVDSSSSDESDHEDGAKSEQADASHRSSPAVDDSLSWMPVVGGLSSRRPSVPAKKESPTPARCVVQSSEVKRLEEQVWDLRRQLQRAEAKSQDLAKRLDYQRRKQNVLLAKQQMDLIETKVQDLEYQILYGDSITDKENTALRETIKKLEARCTELEEAAEERDMLRRKLSALLQGTPMEDMEGTAYLARLELQAEEAETQAAAAEMRLTEAQKREAEIAAEMDRAKAQAAQARHRAAEARQRVLLARAESPSAAACAKATATGASSAGADELIEGPESDGKRPPLAIELAPTPCAANSCAPTPCAADAPTPCAATVASTRYSRGEAASAEFAGTMPLPEDAPTPLSRDGDPSDEPAEQPEDALDLSATDTSEEPADAAQPASAEPAAEAASPDEQDDAPEVAKEAVPPSSPKADPTPSDAKRLPESSEQESNVPMSVD